MKSSDKPSPIGSELMELPYTRCTALVRPPDLTRLLCLGQPPDILTPLVSSVIYPKPPKGVIKPLWERKEDAHFYLESLRVVCTDVMVEPRVVKEPQGDDEISVDELPLRTRTFLFDWATASAYRWVDFCLDKRRMWQVWQRATTYHLLPSAVLQEDDALTAWMIDSAITYLGVTLENALGETVEQGSGKNKKIEAKYKLSQLLAPDFRLPRPAPEMPSAQPQATSGLAAVLAMAGQQGSGVRLWGYVGPPV